MKKLRQRQSWAIFAAVLTFTAIVCELLTHICMFVFDPLPDVWCILAYTFLGVMLLANEHVLHKLHKAVPVLEFANIPRNLAYAQVGTIIALAIALVYSILFVPAFPASLFALMFFGMGVGAWSPFVNLIVLICQWRTLSNTVTFAASPLSVQPLLTLGGFVLLIVMGYGVIPLLAGQNIHNVVQHAPAYNMFSTWWGFINGHHADTNGDD